MITFLERASVDTRSDYAALAYANENGEVKWLQAVGNRSNRYKRMTTSMRQGIFGRVIKLDRPLVMNHLSIRTYQEIQDYAIILTEQLKSFIAIPHYQEERAKGFTNKEIAEQLFISVKTVESHKQRAMEKLNLKSRAELVKYALKKGLLDFE
ncbi:hypothetical protein G3578_20375 [Brevibacillus sp. SYP-B805]|nr:hypothetical protein [Brevibacillus sp. SYP-B805]